MRNLVVGVDGAPSSLRALEWAAATVGPSGRIHAVAAVSPPTELAVVPPPTGRRTYLQLVQRELDLVWTADVRTRVETVDEVRQRLSAALAHIDASQLIAAPDCGLALMPRDLAVKKLTNLSDAAHSL